MTGFMPDPGQILIWVIAVPAAISLVAVLVSHVPPGRERATQPWGPALAIAGAFAAAFVALRGRPPFPPRDAQTWLVYLGGASVLLAVAATVVNRKRWRALIFIGAVALIAAAVWFLGRPKVPIIGWRDFLVRMAVIAACMVAWWVLMDLLAARAKGAAVPLVLMISAAVAALALVNAHVLFFGQLAGAVAAALGAMVVAGLYFRKLSLARGGVLTLTVVLLGIMLAGHFYADLRLLDLMLLSAAPLAAWLGELPFKSRRARFASRILIVLLILLVPLVPALKGLRETMQEQAESYMY